MDPGSGKRSVSVRSDGTRESNQKPSWANAAQGGFLFRMDKLDPVIRGWKGIRRVL
jgi:hypothetical protein